MTVNRWHSHPNAALRNSGDDIDAHQARVCDLCQSLAARIGLSLVGSDLPKAALHHDEAERVLGDMPGPAKERFPALAAAYAKAELQILTERGLTWNLSRIEADILHICDRLDAIRWAADHGVTGGEWDDAIAAVQRRAWRLGPDAVAWVDAHLSCGRWAGAVEVI